ncbi:MAG: hypothetical protein ACKVU1_17660 [bacterium]
MSGEHDEKRVVRGALPWPSTLPLTIVRFAMLFGVLGFGAAAYVMARGGTQPEAAPATLRALQYAGFALLAVSAGATLVLRSRLSETRDEAKQRTLCIIGYALGETPALLGGVVWILGGGPMLYAAALVVFILAIVVLAPRADE